MAQLEDITRGASVRGILPDGLVSIVDVKWIGTVAIEVTYKDAAGKLGSELLYRDREPTLELGTVGKVLDRFHGSVQIDPLRLGRDASRIAEEVVQHLSSIVGADVEITLEIQPNSQMERQTN